MKQGQFRPDGIPIGGGVRIRPGASPSPGAMTNAPNVNQIAIDVENSPLLWFTGYHEAPEKTSERFTADLSDPDKSTLNVVTGQGGNFLSPFYMDQWKAWYQGSTFQLPYSAQAVSAAKKHRLTLNP